MLQRTDQICEHRKIVDEDGLCLAVGKVRRGRENQNSGLKDER